MQLQIKKPSISRDYFLFASFTVAGLLLLATIVAWFICQSIDEQHQHRLSNDTKQIERVIAETFDFTNRILVYMGDQIANRGPDDLEFIYQLFKSTSQENRMQQTNTTFSWSLFDWISADNMQMVNSKEGIITPPVDVSHQQYTFESRIHPWILNVSKPDVGKTNGEWVIPSGTGIVDANNDFLGIIAVKFNIEKLQQRISHIMGSSNVSYIVLDQHQRIILQSIDNNTDPESNHFKKIPDTTKDFLNQDFTSVGILPDPIRSFKNNITYTHAYNMPAYPYTILTGYSDTYLAREYSTFLTPRILEIIILGIFFLVLMYLFRLYMIKPLAMLSEVAEKVNNGEKITQVPRTPSYETSVLAHQLIELQRKMNKIQRIDHKLTIAKETAEKASRAKSEFLASISHELRTPLNAVIGYSEMMKREILGPVSNEHYKEYVNDIYKSGNHLLSLINDILDVTKTESDAGIDLNHSNVDMEHVLNKALSTLSELANEKKIPIYTTIEENIPQLRGDGHRLEQICLHLINNAIKFSAPNHPVHVHLKTSGHQLTLSVQDNGIGMKKEDIPKATEKFTQLDSSLARKEEGIGLGLWLIKTYVTAHEATLDIQSKAGKGTAVTITFPAKRTIFGNVTEKKNSSDGSSLTAIRGKRHVTMAS